jgi:hypothetical protein
LQKIKGNYVDVEKHLFKSNKTFIEYLSSIVNDDEMLEYFNVTNEDILLFIDDITTIENKVDRNTLIKKVNRNNYTIMAYSLNENQSYSKHEAIAKQGLSKYTSLNGKCYFDVMGGVFGQNNNRVYLLIGE